MKVCGVNACQAVAARRPDDVRRVYIHESLLPGFGAFLKRCAAARIAYHVVDHAELERITQSTHHEGVCFIAREARTPALHELLSGDGPRCLVYLDGVQNPHNLGAIVRVCAHFGAAAVLAAGSDSANSTAMLRTAEGGSEWTPVIPVEPGPRPLATLKAAGFRVLTTAARGGRDLYSAPLPRRVVLLLGSETHGVSPALQQAADEAVRIPGTGNLDSLNVACACSVLLGEYWRTSGGEADASVARPRGERREPRDASPHERGARGPHDARPPRDEPRAQRPRAERDDRPRHPAPARARRPG